MSEFKITAERVKQLRDELGVGIQEAHTMLKREQLLIQFDQAQTIEQLKPVLRKILFENINWRIA